LIKVAFYSLKENVIVRKQKQSDPILRRILAMEDMGLEGEFFTVKISNYELETIRGGPLKCAENVTDISAVEFY